ncbi:hypothetical protein [Pseudomonas fluorescens]|uniref:hypothetical protein n=1 Tax=Pseudomonas fluorescens TaxID=294 RepID=UPI0012428112|nr:hypothetical protein [Pseudomonas fluorescens]VVQ30700.1 hypothetical protein PS947_02079 [Pseudomonas fluorescens]
MSWFENVQSLIEKPWFGSLLGIISFIAAIVFYFWSRKRTSLGYVHMGEHLLGSASDALPSAIVVQYNGMSIPRLTKSVLIFWNSGENTVLGSDIVTTDPLRFHVGDDGRILSIAVLQASRSVNDFSFLPTGNSTHEAAFNFNFLDPNDGVVVEILHTSTDRIPRIKGTLRGLPQGFRNFGQFTRPKPQKKKRSGPLSALTTALFNPLVFFCACLLFSIYGPRPEWISLSAFSAVMSLLGGFSGMWAVNSWATRRKYPKSLHFPALE